MSFLHDPTTQFLILCAIGVLTILVPWIIYLKQRGRKEIAYEIISNTSVVSIEGEAKGKVQVLYDGKPVNEANLLLLRVWNSGNLPIPAEDYKEPLTFTFGKEIEILDVEVVEKYPSNLKPSLNRDTQNVILEPLLLNPQESVKLKFLLAQFGNVLNVNARIVGVTEVNRAEATYLMTYLRRTFSIPAIYRNIFTILLVVLTTSAISLFHANNIYDTLSTFLSPIAASLITFTIYWNIRKLLPTGLRLIYVLIMIGMFTTYAIVYIFFQWLVEHPMFNPF